MITAATIIAFALEHGRFIVAEAERDRLARRGDHTVVIESTMPQPSAAWLATWADRIVGDPLFVNDPRRELVHGIVWAYGESGLQDSPPKRGIDGNKTGCSFGVRAELFGLTVAEIEDDPAKCIDAARKAMRWSFGIDRVHPMNRYAGCGAHPSCEVAEAREQIVTRTLMKLPPMKEATP